MTQSKPHLHHEEKRVENDKGHDEVLEGRGDDHLPDLVLEAVPFFGHIPLQRLGMDSEVDTSFLKVLFSSDSISRINYTTIQVVNTTYIDMCSIAFKI